MIRTPPPPPLVRRHPTVPAAQEDDDEYQYTVELVLAKREARVARKGIVVQYAVKWDEWETKLRT